VSSASTKATVQFLPGEAHHGGTAVHVVHGQNGAGKIHVQRAHFGRREHVTGFDGGFARYGGGQSLVLRRVRGAAVTSQRRKRVRRQRSASNRGCGMGTACTSKRVPAEGLDSRSPAA
jgi:hypothetical protein